MSRKVAGEVLEGNDFGLLVGAMACLACSRAMWCSVESSAANGLENMAFRMPTRRTLCCLPEPCSPFWVKGMASKA